MVARLGAGTDKALKYNRWETIATFLWATIKSLVAHVRINFARTASVFVGMSATGTFNGVAPDKAPVDIRNNKSDNDADN